MIQLQLILPITTRSCYPEVVNGPLGKVIGFRVFRVAGCPHRLLRKSRKMLGMQRTVGSCRISPVPMGWFKLSPRRGERRSKCAPQHTKWRHEQQLWVISGYLEIDWHEDCVVYVPRMRCVMDAIQVNRKFTSPIEGAQQLTHKPSQPRTNPDPTLAPSQVCREEPP